MRGIMAPLDPPVGLWAAAVGIMFISARQRWMLPELRLPKNKHATRRFL